MLITRRNKERSFTLIEVMVAVAIIGLLASIVLVSLKVTKQKARDAKRIAELNQVEKAVKLLETDWGMYPGGAADTNTTCDCRHYEGIRDGCSLWYYLETLNDLIPMPQDPFSSNGWAYRYNYLNSGRDFEISARLEIDTSKMENDGGNDPNRYEIGININNIDTSSAATE